MTNKQWLGISFNQHEVIKEGNDPFEILCAIDRKQQLYPSSFNMFQDAELYSIEEIEFIDETDYYLAHHYLDYPPKEEEVNYVPTIKHVIHRYERHQSV